MTPSVELCSDLESERGLTHLVLEKIKEVRAAMLGLRQGCLV